MERIILKCKQCPTCNGVACKGQVPGMGGMGTGSSFIRNVDALKKIKINMDVINNVRSIDTSTILFNKTMKLPLMCAPLAGIGFNYGVELSDSVYNQDIIKACTEQNIAVFTGDGIDVERNFVDPARCLSELGGFGFLTVKPWVNEAVKMRIDGCKGLNHIGFAMDVDAAGLPTLRNAQVPVENKGLETLKEIKAMCGDKPFIIKGVMTQQAARVALEAGADAIIVSNHGGRVLDESLGTIEVLEEIVQAVGGQMTILIDGGFRTGNDIFKAIALGADAVLMGRPMALECVKGGSEAVTKFIEKVEVEFIHAMRMTGCSTVSDITREKIYIIN